MIQNTLVGVANEIWQGLPDIDFRVIGCGVTYETINQSAMVDVASRIWQALSAG
jgi:hypothetical protein